MPRSGPSTQPPWRGGSPPRRSGMRTDLEPSWRAASRRRARVTLVTGQGRGRNGPGLSHRLAVANRANGRHRGCVARDVDGASTEAQRRARAGGRAIWRDQKLPSVAAIVPCDSAVEEQLNGPVPASLVPAIVNHLCPDARVLGRGGDHRRLRRRCGPRTRRAARRCPTPRRRPEPAPRTGASCRRRWSA